MIPERKEELLKEDMGASLTGEERETIISWTDDEEKPGHIFIHTTQLPMMRSLLKNPLFELRDTHRERETHRLFGVDGLLPRSALTIRTKKRVLTPEQRKEAVEHLILARKRPISIEREKKLVGNVVYPSDDAKNEKLQTSVESRTKA